MFSLWGKRGDQTETLPSGIIEMKGSEPQSQAPRKQWRGLWSSWDGSSDNKSVKPKQSPDLVGRSNSYPQPSILRATVLSDNEATSVRPPSLNPICFFDPKSFSFKAQNSICCLHRTQSNSFYSKVQCKVLL